MRPPVNHSTMHVPVVMPSLAKFFLFIYFSAASDRVKAFFSGLLMKLKSIDVGGSVLSICTEFLIDRTQRVVFDGAASE